MPPIYLLLRNNKQSGPHTLEELVQLSLQPSDLIWVDGRSAGWRYPTEIDALKPYVAGYTKPQAVERPLKKAATQTTRISGQTRWADHASHIYVSLPAGAQAYVSEERPATISLEEKAEALYKRVQAFAEGRQDADDLDTRYARSLDDMKQEYGAWLVQQQKKKKSGLKKKHLVLIASVLIITTTSFSISKWISYMPMHTAKPTAATLENNVEKTSVPFQQAGDSTNIPENQLPVLASDNISAGPKLQKKLRNVLPAAKQSMPVKLVLPPSGDTVNNTTSSIMPAEQKAPTLEGPKKNIPLSMLIAADAAFQYDKRGRSIKATEITLQNNSAEVLKTVAVTLYYYKANGRIAGIEKVHFDNVQPGSASVIQASGNRKALTARLQIGTITRADGSLYLIH